MRMARFKHFLGFGGVCPGFSSAGWISSAFKSSAEVDVHIRLHQIPTLEKIGEWRFCLSLKCRVPRYQEQKAVVNIIFFSFSPLLRCKFCFCFGLRCRCSVKHIVRRCEGLTKMSVDVYGDILMFT